MKRRVCESCLYFEPAGFAKNGWCHHPSRRQNTDVRLMVRSNELGCRNGWNADLWVAAVSESDGQRSQPHDPINSRAASEVEPAQQSDLITSIVAAKTDNVTPPEEAPRTETPPIRAAVEEDIFVKQTPSLTWSTGPISSQPATELVQNPKAAILRARDQFRQRRRNEGRLADRQLPAAAAPLLASSREAGLSDQRRVPPVDPVPEYVDPRYENRPLLSPQPANPYESRRPVAPVSLQELDRPFPAMTDFPEDRARFESVPQLDGSFEAEGALESIEDDTWIETRQLDTVPPEPYVIDELFEEEDLPAHEESLLQYEDEELSVRHRESILNRYLRHRRERRSSEIAVDAVSSDDHAPFIANRRPTPPEDVHPAFPQQVVARPARRSEPVPKPRPSADFDDDFALPPPLPEYQPERAQQPTAVTAPRQSRSPVAAERLDNRTRAPQSQTLMTDEFGDQPLFAANADPALEHAYDFGESLGSPASAFSLSDRMERICQTCRDFRPTENGERGWCNNKWAFNHRRMVDADDLACRNSLGSWWTPKDDVWRRDGDISRHAQQTPRVDQWLFGSNSEDQVRRGSGSS